MVEVKSLGTHARTLNQNADVLRSRPILSPQCADISPFPYFAQCTQRLHSIPLGELSVLLGVVVSVTYCAVGRSESSIHSRLVHCQSLLSTCVYLNLRNLHRVHVREAVSFVVATTMQQQQM